MRPWQKEPGGESDKGSRALPAIVHGADPAATIRQIQDIMTDRRNYIPDYEAMTVLERHIAVGYGGHIPDWGET